MKTLKLKKQRNRYKNLKDTTKVYESIQLEAIEGFLLKSFEFFERKVRRWYSKNFSTPLKDTHHIPWEEILLNYYEDAIDSRDYNEILEMAMSDYIPEFAKIKEIEDAEFDRELEEEQKQTIKKKAQKDQGFKEKLEKIGEKVDGIYDKVSKLKEKTQSLKSIKEIPNKNPTEINLKFEDDEEDPDKI